MINKIFHISELEPDEYIALLESNISFTKRHNKLYPKNKMYPKLPSEYGIIAIQKPAGNYDIYYDKDDENVKEIFDHLTSYDEFNYAYPRITIYEIMKCCHAVIDMNNKVIKNRWGDDT